jgi:hypothetical protein
VTSDENAPVDADDVRARPYVLVGGRTTPSRDLNPGELVQASALAPTDPLETHHAHVFGLCSSEPVSVAEIAGLLQQPVQVVKILLADLLDAHYVTVPTPPDFSKVAAADPATLEKVLAGLQRRFQKNAPPETADRRGVRSG